MSPEKAGIKNSDLHQAKHFILYSFKLKIWKKELFFKKKKKKHLPLRFVHFLMLSSLI